MRTKRVEKLHFLVIQITIMLVNSFNYKILWTTRAKDFQKKKRNNLLKKLQIPIQPLFNPIETWKKRVPTPV